ncbi:MAG: type II secretion system F family protein [Candidatus Eremiobacteraeota bacterium]|nr:type II secretion system F family protein [Candidatus Eremiobacteraeota bacterium]
MLIIGVIVLVLAAGGVAAFAMFGKKNAVSDRLAAIDASAGVNPRSDASLFRRLMDDQQQHALSKKLQEAGWYTVTPTAMLLRSATGFGAGLVLGIGFTMLFHMHSPMSFICVLTMAGFGAYYPQTKLNKAITERKISIHRELPDFLDMMSTTVEAGVGLNAALATTVEELSGALGEELRTALGDIRLGRSRSDALIAMSNRVHESDLTTMVMAIVQSERIGASIAGVLDQLAAEARERRLMRAEEVAGQLPNKLIFPMALCMLPALFVIIFGSVLAKFMSH